ncbi:hypothetical protein ACFC3Z_11685 [Enterococcus thailandicus]|uniref:hypothetical protein n=1 Tax=Enterococcus thailandicus TaxID=417368 RepID=UPI0035D6069B
MKKTVLASSLGLLLVIGTLGTPLVHADVQDNNVIQTSTVKEGNVGIDPYTLIVAANGNLEGQMVPYIEGLDFTGKMDLHYSAQNYGFVDGDVGVLMIKLPEQFKFVASVPDFARHVTGNVSAKTLLGHKTEPISPENVQSYSDRILITVPNSFWIGQGDVTADITIDYGGFLAQYPTLPIPDAPMGYEFQAQLKYDSAMWDVITDPIIGTDDETLFTTDTSAIYK